MKAADGNEETVDATINQSSTTTQTIPFDFTVQASGMTNAEAFCGYPSGLDVGQLSSEARIHFSGFCYKAALLNDNEFSSLFWSPITPTSNCA
jgi:hypothetical protein